MWFLSRMTHCSSLLGLGGHSVGYKSMWKHGKSEKIFSFPLPNILECLSIVMYLLNKSQWYEGQAGCTSCQNRRQIPCDSLSETAGAGPPPPPCPPTRMSSSHLTATRWADLIVWKRQSPPKIFGLICKDYCILPTIPTNIEKKEIKQQQKENKADSCLKLFLKSSQWRNKTYATLKLALSKGLERT